MNAPIVVTGAAGMLNSVILETFGPDVPVVSVGSVVGLRRDQLDIASAGSVERVLAPIRPAVIINCAICNGVDNAEFPDNRLLSPLFLV